MTFLPSLLVGDVNIYSQLGEWSRHASGGNSPPCWTIASISLLRLRYTNNLVSHKKGIWRLPCPPFVWTALELQQIIQLIWWATLESPLVVIMGINAGRVKFRPIPIYFFTLIFRFPEDWYGRLVFYWLCPLGKRPVMVFKMSYKIGLYQL